MAKLNKEISVMLPRETAEEIIKRAELHDTTNTKTPFLANIEGLARAYLELEKKLSLEQQDRKSEKREFKVFKDAAENEITKLKKSREGLRQACEFYASSDQWNCTKEQLTTYNTIDKDDLGIGDFQFACDVDDDRVGGKKAREALEADDELMK